VLTEKCSPAIKAVDNCRFINPLLPIIILASNSDEAYESLVVSKKAVCCFIRPFPFRQITAEMKYAIFCHREKIEIGKYVFRDLEMDVMSHSVKIKNMPVYLRNKEFSLLHYLMANRGRVVTRTDILHHVWDRNTNILTNTVDVHVSILRKKLESVVNERYIRTVPCLGYMLE
jgi:DNA-binding response OmpR family regulator